MNVTKKTIITAVLVVAVVGVLILQTTNNNLFKGQLFTKKQSDETTTEIVSTDSLPDLTATLEILPPTEIDGNISASVTIKNDGPGTLGGDSVFRYALHFNGVEVFSNVDSYTTMAAGDSFNFVYPVSRAIYKYENSGSAKIVVDSEDTIEESNEDNNEVEKTYNF